MDDFAGGTGIVIAEFDGHTGELKLNLDAFTGRFRHHHELMAGGAHATNLQIVDEIVVDAQSRVPVRTGKLRAGITREFDGKDILYVASAQAADRGAEDYAHFVEFGTSGASDDGSGLYSGSGAAASAYNRPRRAVKAGTKPAEPFYLPALHAALSRHGKAMREMVDVTGQQSGFTVS